VYNNLYTDQMLF